MEFQFLTGDVNWQEYGGKWVSPRLNNGDWDYWLVIEFINFLDATGEMIDGLPFVIEIAAVSPDAAGYDNVIQALESYGWSDQVEEKDDLDPLLIVESLHGYGIAAHLWSAQGDDADIMLDMAKDQAPLIEMLFGFHMDRPENRIGSTGWDFISGDILRPLGL